MAARRRAPILLLITALTAGTGAAAGALHNAPPGAGAPHASPGVAVPVTAVAPKQIAAKDGTGTPYKATELSWPAPVTASVELRPGARTRAGASDVWVQPASSYQGPAKAVVTVAPHAAAQKAGIAGVVMTVAGSGSGSGRVQVGLDYTAFAQQYGGNYGARLKLVRLPACALTTPERPGCQKQNPVGSANDSVHGTVTADVDLSGSAAPMVLAATSTAGSDGSAGGSYAATSLKPAASWNEGGDSGSFDYSYPITLPGASGKLMPTVAMSYNSQSVDGQTAVTQAQSSWVGDGWGLPDSFVEQTFASCADSPEGTSLPASEATGDACYDGPILALSLNGVSTALVCDSAETQCTLQQDNGDTVSHVVNSASNGSGVYDGTDYWVVTERSGTKYYFGMDQLPGYAGGSLTNSVDTEPVFSANSGDPCYSSAGFAASVCTMAYRWHLDYVTDLTGQAMAYSYRQATNYYGEDDGAHDVPYVRDSSLAEIDYGFPAGDAYGTSAPVPDRVLFTPNADGRCVQSSCTALTSSSMTSTLAGAQYPDVPYDLLCASGANCVSYAPSFFSTDRLAAITTEQNGTAIDSYALTQKEPATGDTTNSTLWLASIQRTASDTSGGAASGPVTMPPVTFDGVDLPNRVNTASFPGLYRYRISSITSELGSVTSVTYSAPDPCTVAYVTSQTSASASANANSCYPVYWTPVGYSNPIMDWFESYAVAQVLVADSTGGSANQETGSLTQESDYKYGDAAWHYDDNEVVKAKYRTYGQFRGYSTVTTYNGQPADNPQTEKIDTYYRGMDGDPLTATSNRSVTLTDSQKGTHTDSAALAGSLLESQVFDGSGGPLETDTITSYWVSGAVQTRSRTGLPDLVARMTGTQESWKSQTTTDGGKIGTAVVTETDTSYDTGTSDANFGLAQYSYMHTVPQQAAYDSCTTTRYASANATANLVGLASYQETDSVACGGFTEGAHSSAPNGTIALSAPSAAAVAAPTHVVSATQTFYDDPAFSGTQPAPPTVGLVTMTRKASDFTGGAFVWQTEQRQTYDSYGRVVKSLDPLGNVTTTSYTVTPAGLTTGTTVTAPSTNGVAHVTSTAVDPTRDLTLTSTDVNGIVTTRQYDALGRLTAVWKASGYQSGLPANIRYTYTVSNTADSGVVTQTLNDEGAYNTSVEIEDSLGRVRETQLPTPQGGRLISDTVYDSRGWNFKKNTNYWDSTTAPTLALVTVADADSLNQDEYVYDGLGRTVQDLSRQNAATKAVTTTVYNGDATTVVPPAGGVVKTTYTDPLGRTSKLVEYNTTAPTVSVPANAFTGLFSVSGGTPMATTYGYDGHGDQTTTTDAAGDAWSGTYNLLGQETSSTDPDLGTTSMQYDADGHLLQSKDTENNYMSYTYDALGRKTGSYAAASNGHVDYSSASAPGNELASWTYDNSNNAVPNMLMANGQPTTTTTYANGSAFVQQALGFNRFGESVGASVTVPAAAAGSTLGTKWTVRQYYTAETGLLQQTVYPAGGGLPAETVSYTYTTALDLPSGVGSSLVSSNPGVGYAQGTTYTALAQVAQTELGNGTSDAYLTDTYDPHTGALNDQLVSRNQSTSSVVDNTSYTYDPAGLTTSETDTRLGSAATSETQCYTYTPQDQLSAAWTATDGCATTPTASSHATVGDALGAASTYWQTYTYNSAGDRNVQTVYQATNGQIASTQANYNGNATAQPTTLTSAVTTGAAAGSSSYAYNPDGQQKARTTALGSQQLTWNNAGQLVGVATTSGGTTMNSSYVYDVSGNLLLQTEGQNTTLYLVGEQISANAATGAVAGNRFYGLPGGASVVRYGSDTSYDFELSSDQHGTNTLSLDSTAQTPTWRQFDPYGNPRGATAAWADDRGFLGKVDDASTGLTNVGARWYDPATGSFVSPDPVLEKSDPTQLGGYDYAGGDPVSSSDPSGRYRSCGPADSGCQTQSGLTTTYWTGCAPGTHADMNDGSCVDNTITVAAPDGTRKTVDADSSPFDTLDPERFAKELDILRHMGYRGSNQLTYADLLNWSMSSTPHARDAWILFSQSVGLTTREMQADPMDGTPNIYQGLTLKDVGTLVAVGVAIPVAFTALAACLPADEACIPLTLTSVGIKSGASLMKGDPVADVLVEAGMSVTAASFSGAADDVAELEAPTGAGDVNGGLDWAYQQIFKSAVGVGDNGFQAGEIGAEMKAEGGESGAVKVAASAVYRTDAQGEPDPTYPGIFTFGFMPSPYS